MDNNFTTPSEFGHSQPQEIKSNLSVFAKQEYYGLAKWVLFMAIVIAASLTLMLISTFFAGSAINEVKYNTPQGVQVKEASFALLFFMWIVVIGIYLYPTMMLFRFAKDAKKAVRYDDDFAFECSIKYLRRFFKYIGILMIIFISFFALVYLSTGLGYMLGNALQ